MTALVMPYLYSDTCSTSAYGYNTASDSGTFPSLSASITSATVIISVETN